MTAGHSQSLKEKRSRAEEARSQEYHRSIHFLPFLFPDILENCSPLFDTLRRLSTLAATSDIFFACARARGKKGQTSTIDRSIDRRL